MKLKLFAKHAKVPGSAPGTVVHVGEQKMEKVRIRVIRYDAAAVDEREFESILPCLEYCAAAKGVKWINIDGLHDTALLRTIGEAYGVHPLVMEDIVNTRQRPKAEIDDRSLFAVMKMFYPHADGLGIDVEQMSFVLTEDTVLSFQERVGDVFGEVRRRIRAGGSGFIRKAGADFLFYALTDAIVDHYFVVLEKIGADLDSVDEELSARPDPGTLRRIHDLKKEVVFLKNMTWPLRELFGSILRSETPLVHDKTRVFLRDVQDHTMQVLDGIESYREMITGLTDMYQSSVANKMNEVMKVLTIIATLFIPPTFIAGIYGMNFENIPELHVKNGYFIFWGVTVTGIASMLIFFRKKKWF